MNLANDLVRKAGGYIHTMPKPKPKSTPKPSTSAVNEKPSRYLDEEGKPTRRCDIAQKYNVSPAKVKFLFDRHEYQEVYRLINIDGRAGNGQRGIYHYPDGSDASYAKLAKFYNVSSTTIQRVWRNNNKDSVLANAEMAIKNKY